MFTLCGNYCWSNQAAGIFSPPLLVGRPSSNGLSCVWTTTWSLAWTKSGQWWQRTWCIQGFNCNWKLPLQTVSKGLQTATQYALKKGVITLRKDAVCICHRLYKKLVIQSLYVLTLPQKLQIFSSIPRNEVVIIWLLIFHTLYTSFLLLSAKQYPK